MLEDALDVLEHELQAGNPKVAVQVIKLARLVGLGQPTGETDAHAIVDDLAMKKRGPGLPERLVLEEQGKGPVAYAEQQAVLEDLESQLAEAS